jgi:hypothetical protein
VIAVVWQFDVKPAQHEEFEHFYGADGAWTALSRRSRSFLGSSFLRDLTSTERYLLVEYWSEMVVYEKHLTDFRDDTESLEQRRDELVARWEHVGVFQALNVPDRAGPAWSRRGEVD